MAKNSKKNTKNKNIEKSFPQSNEEDTVENKLIKELKVLHHRVFRLEQLKAWILLITFLNGIIATLILLKEDQWYKFNVSRPMYKMKAISLFLLWQVIMYLSYNQRKYYKGVKALKQNMNKIKGETVTYRGYVYRVILLLLGLYIDYKTHPYLEKSFPHPLAADYQNILPLYAMAFSIISTIVIPLCLCYEYPGEYVDIFSDPNF